VGSEMCIRDRDRLVQVIKAQELLSKKDRQAMLRLCRGIKKDIKRISDLNTLYQNGHTPAMLMGRWVVRYPKATRTVDLLARTLSRLGV